MKLEITKDRVLEAASKCSTAKETLKTLFPEVFKSKPAVEKFQKAIADMLNHDGELYDVYKQIPGTFFEDKAAHIIKLLGLND